MAVSAYKGYELIVTGSEVDTWGDKLNTAVFDVIDKNLGGLVSKSLTNVNVTLTADENKNLILRLNGTLTGAVLITTTLEGVMIVENLTTGAFAVTFTNGVGAAITLPQSARSIIIADSTNGARSAGDNVPEFPSGTKIIFQQNVAPTGWTKDTNGGLNHALRLTGGTLGSGGSVPFTTAMASQAVTGSCGNTTLTTSQIPLHSHPTFTAHGTTSGSDGSGGIMLDNNGAQNDPAYTGTPTSTAGLQIGGEGGGQAHTHTFTGNPINMAIAYIDVCICTKN